jgi:hypothetical protein
MPKMIDPELKARAVRLVSEHRGEYPTLTAASQAVAPQPRAATRMRAAENLGRFSLVRVLGRCDGLGVAAGRR